MSTANNSKNSEMTTDAYDLLECFVSGLDKIIYEIAEDIAERKGQVLPEGAIEIRADDIRMAADVVFKAIREQTGKSIPKDLAVQIEEMHECVLEKCRIRDVGK